ncbi:hypothetical protein GOP47_0027414 [Adiantum capillus-veneris]|nr:hypothetical protein GOP47_0027414 [Adiantum capillus-veneris]
MLALLAHVGKGKECTPYSYSDVRIITNNFKKVLGAGGFGLVYYGELPADRRPVAVKVLSASSHQGEREFLNEVDLLSRIHHRNLVTLCGYCVEKKLVLIYEYMSNGSLLQALQGKCSMLNTWKDYLRVACDAAEGLEYLHNGCNPEIIHRDVKSSNILLSHELRAKLSDFGISRSKLSTTDGPEMFTAVQGSVGYIDPEYAERQLATSKVDVYAFGIVLLEICSVRPVLTQEPARQHLAEWAKFHVERGNIHEVFNSLFDRQYNLSAAWKVIDVAMRCVEFESRNRPNMSEVCLELKSALSIELQGEVDNTTNSMITAEITAR